MSLNLDSLKLLFEVELKKCPMPGVKQIKIAMPQNPYALRPNFSDDFEFNGVPTLAIELRISFLNEVCIILM